MKPTLAAAAAACVFLSFVQPVQAETDGPACMGTVALPNELSDDFEPVDDPELLKRTLGGPTEGKLCRGKVYQAKADTDVIIYRAWNSTNPYSQMGKWWALNKPEGKVAQYREDYEICYQWSPLDKLVRCELKPGTKVVVGTGQSATCSQYLTYPASPKRQMYIENAADVVENCTEFDAVFSWR